MNTDKSTIVRKRQRTEPRRYTRTAYSRNSELRRNKASRINETEREKPNKTVKGSRLLRWFILLVKQTAAVAIIILIYMLLKKGNFEFSNNCLSSLGRAIRWELDLNTLQSGVVEWFSGVIQFWSDIT